MTACMKQNITKVRHCNSSAMKRRKKRTWDSPPPPPKKKKKKQLLSGKRWSGGELSIRPLFMHSNKAAVYNLKKKSSFFLCFRWCENNKRDLCSRIQSLLLIS